MVRSTFAQALVVESLDKGSHVSRTRSTREVLLLDHGYPIRCVALTGKYVVSGDMRANEDNRIAVWDVHTGAVVHELQHTRGAYSFAVCDDEDTLVIGHTGHFSSALSLWSLRRGELLHLIKKAHVGEAVTVAASGDYVVSKSVLNEASVWSLPSLVNDKATTPLRKHKAHMSSFAVSQGYLFGVSTRKMLFQWDLQAAIKVRSMNIPARGILSANTVSTPVVSGEWLVLGQSGRSLLVYNWRRGRLLVHAKGVTATDPFMIAMHGDTIVCGPDVQEWKVLHMYVTVTCRCVV